MRSVSFQPVPLSASRFSSAKATTQPAPLDDLRAAWQDPQVRPMIEASITHGNFKHVPDQARSFLAKLQEVCTSAAYRNNDARYDALHTHFQRPQENNRQLDDCFVQEKDERVERRVEQVKDVLNGFKPANYVDIGSGDGKITSGLRELLQPRSLNVKGTKSITASPRRAIGLEVAPSGRPPEGMNLVQYDGIHFPLKRNGIDMMTLFAVLHHVEDPLALLVRLKDFLKPGGRLVVREFDAGTEAMKRFNIVMDDMLYKVYNPNPDVPCPGTFKSREEWLALFRQAGFQVDKLMSDPEPTNPYKPFMVALKKPA